MCRCVCLSNLTRLIARSACCFVVYRQAATLSSRPVSTSADYHCPVAAVPFYADPRSPVAARKPTGPASAATSLSASSAAQPLSRSVSALVADAASSRSLRACADVFNANDGLLWWRQWAVPRVVVHRWDDDPADEPPPPPTPAVFPDTASQRVVTPLVDGVAIAVDATTDMTIRCVPYNDGEGGVVDGGGGGGVGDGDGGDVAFVRTLTADVVALLRVSVAVVVHIRA